MYRIAFAAVLLAAAALAGCSSSPSPPAAVQVAEPADPCAKYPDPTENARCQLYTGADAWRWVPLAGRSADLDAKLRCAPFRHNSGPYERCIAQQIVAHPRVEPEVQPSARPPATRTVQEPRAQAALPPARAGSEVREPSPEPPAAVARSKSREIASPAPAVERTYRPAPPAVAPPKQVSRSAPYCAENGSCYGDISSYTKRPKTVHVRGYYRKDGTYVRSHYRSRPRQ